MLWVESGSRGVGGESLIRADSIGSPSGDVHLNGDRVLDGFKGCSAWVDDRSVGDTLGEMAPRFGSIGGSGALGERAPWVECGDIEGDDDRWLGVGSLRAEVICSGVWVVPGVCLVFSSASGGGLLGTLL